MPTIDVLDALGAPQAIEVPNTNGRRSAALSRPTVASNEDFAKWQEIVDRLTDGPVVDALQGLLSALQGVLTVGFDGPQAITGTLDAVLDGPTFPGYKPGDLVTVIDGSPRVPYTQTIVTGTGSAVTVLAANANRKAIVFLPAGAANDWIYNFNGTAASGASPIYPPAGGPFVLAGKYCPAGALSLLGTSSQKLVVWEFA